MGDDCPNCGSDLKRFTEAGDVVYECTRDPYCYSAYNYEHEDGVNEYDWKR